MIACRPRRIALKIGETDRRREFGWRQDLLALLKLPRCPAPHSLGWVPSLFAKGSKATHTSTMVALRVLAATAKGTAKGTAKTAKKSVAKAAPKKVAKKSAGVEWYGPNRPLFLGPYSPAPPAYLKGERGCRLLSRICS